MKQLRCPNCGAVRIGPKTAKWPDGAPVVWGHFSGGSNWVAVKCHRCTNSFKLNAIEFNGLPAMTDEQRNEFVAPLPNLL